MAITTFLLIAWILSWFKIDHLVIQAVHELFDKEITTATYYFAFLIFGAVGDIILLFQGAYITYLFAS